MKIDEFKIGQFYTERQRYPFDKNYRGVIQLTRKDLEDIVYHGWEGAYEPVVETEIEKATSDFARNVGSYKEAIKNITIGHHLKQIRKSQNLTLEQAAEKAGFTKSAMHQYESGLRNPKNTQLQNLASVYGVVFDIRISAEGIEITYKSDE